VFDGSITSVSHEGAPGDLAVIFDDRRRFVAIGLWDPGSPIRVRILHLGRPTTIDETFWRSRVADAWQRRGALDGTHSGGSHSQGSHSQGSHSQGSHSQGSHSVEPGSGAPGSGGGDVVPTTGMRLINGENDGFGGLVCDRYGDHLVIKVYSDAWFCHLSAVVDALESVAAERGVALTGVLVRMSRQLAATPLGVELDGTSMLGPRPDGPVRFLELGLAFEADLIRGQKTGHFLDQRDNRAMVGRAALGASVLDVFCCTGGFAVHAAAGGARSVHLVDQSQGAIATGLRNLDLNAGVRSVELCRREHTVGDAFEVMASMVEEGRRFEMVVIDPPSFAQRRSNVAAAIRAYARLAELGSRLVDEGGMLVTASCSSRVGVEDFAGAVRRGADRAGCRLDELTRTGHPVDHPVTFPEGTYLKAIHSRVHHRR